jgi:ATP-dependent DNA helicase PIF1
VKDPETFIRKCLRKIHNEKPLLKKWKNINIIIIDEISMMGGTYLHFLNIIARELREDKRPFGGIQIIASGDMLQLPPVKDIFPFEAPIWNDLKFINIVLSKAYRFENQSWSDCLQRIRLQKTTTSDVNLLKKCANKYQSMFENNDTSEPGEPLRIKPTILCPVNAQVDKINNEELAKINGTSFTYNSIDICGTPEKDKDEIDFSKFKKCTIDEIEFLDKELIVPSFIELKIGAQVMLLINLDVELGLVNGSRGIVQKCEETVFSKAVWVLFENHSEPIKVEYEKCHLIEDFEGKVYLRTMLPLKLSWAFSFHKAQGSTLESAIVNCGRGIFTEGQAYVALSRVRNSDNLYLSEFFPSKITTNKKALLFEQKMLKNSILIDSIEDISEEGN